MKLPSIVAAVLVLATSTQNVYAQDAYTQRFGLNNLEMLCVVNLVRERVGVAPLAHCDAVATVATKHSVNMDRTIMAHTLNGLDPFERLRRAGIDSRASAENIAKGQGSLDNVMQDWISSCGHYKNLVNPAYNEAGFGRAGDSWCQDFVSLDEGALPLTAVDMDQCRQVIDFSVYSFAKADRCPGAPRPVRVITSNSNQDDDDDEPEPAAPPPPAPEQQQEEEEEEENDEPQPVDPVVVSDDSQAEEEEEEEAAPQPADPVIVEDSQVAPEEDEEEEEEDQEEDDQEKPRKRRWRHLRFKRRFLRRFSGKFRPQDESVENAADAEDPAKEGCTKK